MEQEKFKVKVDLALFEAIQKDGRLSEEGIAKKTGISSTTVHYALERIRERDFFKILAVPILKRFMEIPMAVIGFSNVHPAKIEELKDEYKEKQEILQFIHSKKDVVLFVMDESEDALTKTLFKIMEELDEKPCLYITSPDIAKFSVTIPEKILEAIYSELPDRRFKT